VLRYLYADQLSRHPRLAATMFANRAGQFRDRLGWEVAVDAAGHERDAYDALNPLYVSWERPDGRHGGSMRFLPTAGRTMLDEHFSHLTEGVRIASPLIWECTRFCLAPGAEPRVSAALMLGGAELGKAFALSHAAGVFDARMVRIYRRLGWGPTILGTDGTGREAISVGLWDFAEPVRPRLLQKAGISDEVSRHWFERSFGGARPVRLAATG